MHDPLISSAKVLATAIWTLAGLLLLSGWVVMLTDDGVWEWALMLSLTGVAVVGVALVLHVRCYVLRLVAIIRLAHGMAGEHESRELHTVP